MPVTSANRPVLARVESMPNLPQAPKNELPDVRSQAGNTSPPTLAAKDNGTRQRLFKNALKGALPDQMKAAGQSKVAPKENRDEGSKNQGEHHSGKRDAPAIAQPRAGGTKPASKPEPQPAAKEDKGHPFLDLFGKFGEVFQHAMDISSKLLQQVTEMLMATISRASKSADQVNRL